MNTLTTELLRLNMQTDVFVETGTARGEGVQAAIDVGFRDIWSIECDVDVFVQATRRFVGHENVNIMLGDSVQVLPVILGQIEEPATFWLDAHWSTGEPEGLADKCPLLRELAAIERHAIKSHVIMVDDIRYFRSGLKQWHNIKLPEIEEAIRAINPEYSITYHEGVTMDDILVASLPKG